VRTNGHYGRGTIEIEDVLLGRHGRDGIRVPPADQREARRRRSLKEVTRRGLAAARSRTLRSAEPYQEECVQFPTNHMRRAFRLPVRLHSAAPRAVVLAGMLGLAFAAVQIAAAAPADAAPMLRYVPGYTVQGSWLCYGWGSGTYHCTQHWHRNAAGRLVSDNVRWVPNYGSSVSTVRRHADVRRPVVRHTAVSHATVSHATVNRPAISQPAAGQSVTSEIVAVFGPYAGAALNVARCESGFNPSAFNAGSGASGVFQFLRSTWATTSYAGYSPFNASANIHAAYQVFSRDGFSWREWQCQP